jgi:hypothetical protein
MKGFCRFHFVGIRSGLSLIALVLALALQSVSAENAGTEERDGKHDFDFNIGVWRTQIHRVLDPLAGSTQSIDLNGAVTVRKIWGGRAGVGRNRSGWP